MSILNSVAPAVVPTGAVGVSVPNGGAVYTYGAWTEVIASTSGVVALIEILMGTGIVGINHIEIQVGVGGAGVESAICTTGWIIVGPSNCAVRTYPLRVPVTVASGQRVSLRFRQDDNSSGSNNFSLRYVTATDSTHVTDLVPSVLPSGSMLSITPSGTDWANSAWVQLTAGFSDLSVLLDVPMALGNDLELDVGLGGAGSEAVATTLRRGAINAQGGPGANAIEFPVPFLVNPGVRVALRMRKPGTSTSAHNFLVNYIGNITFLAIRVTQAVVEVFTDEFEDDDIPEIAAPCSGGGAMPTGTNPSAGTSLATAVAPQFWLEIDVGGASPTTLRIAKGAIPDVGSAKEPRVLSFNDVSRSLVDAQGLFETAHLEVEVSDFDHLFRGYMEEVWSGASAADALVDRPARLYARDTATAGTAQIVFQGYVRECLTGRGDLTATLVIEDALSVEMSTAFGDEKLVPPALITSAISDAEATEEMIDKPLPLAYGSLSDEADGDAAVGVVPARYVRTLNGYDHYLICLGAVKNIQSAFGADYLSSVIEPTARFKFADSAWGDWAFAPHKPGWDTFSADPWYEVGGKRYTMLILDQEHVVSRLAREGRVPVSVNLCGYEDTGDGTGTMIDAIERQLLHFLVNFVFDSYDGTGNWATSIPALGSYSAIDTASFEATKTAGEAMLLYSGIVGAALIAHDLQQRTAGEVIAQFCRSGAMEIGVNRYGQLMLTRLDRTDDGSGATTRTDVAHILRGTFRLSPARDEVVNIVPYVYGRNYLPTLAELAPESGARLPLDPYRGAWLSGVQSVTDGTSGTRRAKTQEYEMLRDSETAAFVAQEFCDLRSKPRLVAEWTERLTGTAIELGDLVALTNYKGTGSTGWAGRRVQVRRHRLLTDRRNVTVTARDVDDLLA